MRHIVLFCFNDTATTEIYTLSLHDALPIWLRRRGDAGPLRPLALHTGSTHDPLDRSLPAPARAAGGHARRDPLEHVGGVRDRKSTRLNSSHANISYAVFCLKKKKNVNTNLS